MNARRPEISTSLKLLFVNSSLSDGGSEKAMSHVAGALAESGHDLTMALVREKERTYPVDSRIKLIQFKYGKKNKAQKSLTRIWQIRSLIASGKYDYVVCYMWDLNITTLLASLGLRTRIIVSERAYPGTPTRGRLSRFLERLFYRFAYRIVYQTREAKEFCPPELRSRSVIVPNIIPPSESEKPQGKRSQRIVSIGRLDTQKNLPLLLRSFALFIQAHPEWTLEIYGKGPLEAELRSLVDRLGVADSVAFFGYVTDLSSRIFDAGMFVLSSDFEGISNALSEAMELGLPVVSTDCPVGGAALLIQNRVSGMLVPVGDHEALVSAMHEVATDDSLAMRLSTGAQESVAQFGPQQMVQVWEESVLC